MKPCTSLAYFVDISFYQEDILVISTSQPYGSIERQKVLLSIVALSAKELGQISLLAKVVEDHQGVSTWRTNNIIEESRKTQRTPFELILTYNYLVIKEYFGITEQNSELMMEQAVNRLLTTRTAVLSTLATGFNLKILSKNELLTVYRHRTGVNAAKQYIPFDKAFIRPIVELERVPKRIIPKLPFSYDPIIFPLGTHFMNSQKQVGLTQLSELIVLGGSERRTLIGVLQQYLANLAQEGKKVIVLDCENELNGLISKWNEYSNDNVPMTVLRIGHNLQLNLCKLPIPEGFNSRESQITYQANILGNLLAFASGSRDLHANLSHLQSKLQEAIKFLPSEELSLKNITRTDRFTDANTDLEFSLSEQLQTSLNLYAEAPELNFQTLSQDYTLLLTPQQGLVIYQFPNPLLPIKRVLLAYLLHTLSMWCDSETIIVVTNASQIFTEEHRENEEVNQKVYTETLGNAFTRITRSGCLTLVTHSLIRLHPDIQQYNSTGVYFRFSSHEEREWIAQRYALSRYMEDPNCFLQSLNQEGLLFNHTTPNNIEHFIPHTLLPVILN